MRIALVWSKGEIQSQLFEKGRYHYELYEDYTLTEQRELGKYWVSIGAPTEEAVVQYHPLELRCLIAGLSAFIDKVLKTVPSKEVHLRTRLAYNQLDIRT